MLLTEIRSLDTSRSVPWHWKWINQATAKEILNQSSKTMVDSVARFDVGGNVYEVVFYFDGVMPETKPLESIYDVSFVQLKQTEVGEYGTIHMTGAGNALIVLKTVIAVIEDFLRRVKPGQLTMSSYAEERGRTKLYNRGVPLLAQQNGYQYEQTEHFGEVTYTLTRKDLLS